MVAEADQNNTFNVTVARKEVVATVLPLQEHWLPLSNLDLLLPPVDVGVFFCYDKNTFNANHASFLTMVSDLKKALSQVLVSYYAFAGELVTNSIGEPELLCNNRGVDFVEAYADVELKGVDLYNPDESIEGKLVPTKKDGVLAVQVTELKCGSLVVACTFDHRIADAYSANMFLVSWAETARTNWISCPPCFRRSLLSPRRPGHIDPSLDNMYAPIPKSPPPEKDLSSDSNINTSTVPPLASRIYYIEAKELVRLQSFASSNGCKRTKLESFCGFLWQMVAKSATKVKNGRDVNDKVTKLGIVVDGRSRLIDNNTKASLMRTYFGNVLSIPFGANRVGDLIDKPLTSITNEVHEFLEDAVTNEHFLGLIDWVEAHRPDPALAKIYMSGNEDGPALVVSSGQRFPVSKMDFGWGIPLMGSYHFPWGGSAGYVMPMPSPINNGDWIVYMHLFKEQLEFMEAEASHFFKPLSYDYLVNY